MLGIWFTYKKDKNLLKESIRSWRKLGGTVAVFDEHRLPMEEDIGADFYKRTKWNRRGNLNGWECIYGILESIVEACDEFGEEGGVKIDSDTIITGTSWVDQKAPLCGFAPGFPTTCSGMAYWCRKEAAQAVLKMMNKEWLSRSNTLPEDETISHEIMYIYGQKVIAYPWGEQKKAGGYVWSGEIEPERYSKTEVLSFGNPDNRPARPVIAAAMADWLDNRVLPSQKPS